MGVQIILNKCDLFCIGKHLIGQGLENIGKIYGRAPLCHLDMAPSFKRGEQHKHVARAISFILIIMARRLTRLHWNGFARLDNQLLQAFIQADQWIFRVTRAVVNLKYILHIRDKFSRFFGRDDPAFLLVRFQDIFFSVRPIVL